MFSQRRHLAHLVLRITLVAAGAIFALGLLGHSHARADDPDPGATDAPAATDQPPPTAPMPVELIIPSLHIDAPIETISYDADGGMADPSGPDSVGWFSPGFRPGDPGNAVIGGHLDWVDRAAIFWFLKDLSQGDEIDVVYDDNSENVFTVDDVEIYPDEDLPLESIFGTSDSPHLNLITCTGVFDHTTHNYDHRIVVYTTLQATN